MDKSILDDRNRDKVSVIFITLNNEKDIKDCLDSLSHSQFDQLIVVDGGSSDRTREIAKQYTNEVYVTERGIANQHLYSVAKAQHKYLFGIEADNRFPPGFIQDFIAEFKTSGFFGMQPTIEVLEPKNFFERGLKTLYDLNFERKGRKNIIGGPNLYETEGYRNVAKVENFQGYSIDTKLAEIYAKQNLSVGIGHAKAFVKKPFTWKSFVTKQVFYGYGDYDFYTSHCGEWTWRRKLKSLTHPGRQYFIRMPWLALINGHFEAIFYFWLVGVIRYYGWAKMFLLKKIGRRASIH